VHIAETNPIVANTNVANTNVGQAQTTLRELLVSKPLQYDSGKISRLIWTIEAWICTT
jgi:hypothetical protein